MPCRTTSVTTLPDRCAERSTNADLGRALGDEVPEHAVQPDGREHERQHTEQAEERRAETERQHVTADPLGERLHGHERQVAAQALERGAHRRRVSAPGCASSR